MLALYPTTVKQKRKYRINLPGDPGSRPFFGR